MVFTMAITEGDDVSAQVMRTWFGDFGAEFVKTGFEVTEGTELNAAVSAGTGSTAVAATDLALTTQLGSLKSYVPGSLHNNTYSNKAEATYYFDYTEADYYGTWAEIGLYAANGTDLLTHSLISPTKTFSNTKTMTVYYVIEF